MELPKTTNKIRFHQIIEKKVGEVEYGTVTVNVILKDSEPLIESLNIVKARRWKFKSEGAPTNFPDVD